MGYEGHVMASPSATTGVRRSPRRWQLLAAAHAQVGGDVISAGGTGTFDLNDRVATEIQAGSYSLMDTYYAKHGLPFRLAFCVLVHGGVGELERPSATPA